MLQKQPVNINFSQGVETKIDPFQIPVGSFADLQNSVFTVAGRLTKRNGFGNLPSLPDATSLCLTTFKDSLLALGPQLQSYSAGTRQWINKGSLQPVSLSTLPVLRGNTSQSQVDSVTASSGLTCIAYTDQDPSNLANKIFKYSIIDSTNGNIIVSPIQLIDADATYGTPRVFLLDQYFIIVYTSHPSTYHLQYLAISTTNPNSVIGPTDIASSYIPSTTLNFDGYALGSRLYLAYNTTSGGQSVKVTYLTSTLIQLTPITLSGAIATLFTLAADTTNPQNPGIWVTYYDSASGQCHTTLFDQNLNLQSAFSTLPLVFTTSNILNLTSVAHDNNCMIYAELDVTYGYDATLHTNSILCTSVSSVAVIRPTITSIRGMGLASKAFIMDGNDYCLMVYSGASSQTTYQPTYFLMQLIRGGFTGVATNGSSVITNVVSGGNYPASLTNLQIGMPGRDVATRISGNFYLTQIDTAKSTVTSSVAAGSSGSVNAVMLLGKIVAKLAYSNGPSYYATGLSNVTVRDNVVYIPYLFKDLIIPVNKVQNANSTTGVYAQLGINLATFDTTGVDIESAEIGGNLNLTGGLVSMYDGTSPVEHGFNVWPDYIKATWSATGGSMAALQGGVNANAYFYQVTYEWTDNQGNIFRSAPSIPVAVTTTGSATTGSVVLNIPTLRATAKYANPVRIVIYRWSIGQPVYYQATSITTPTLNNPFVDSITYTDVRADSSIIGNSILYTTGGVLEDIAPPATDVMCLFNNRLWLVDAEDRNLLWFSKPVIESTPVEMSDLLTLYVAPTTGAIGSTGPVAALAPMDDKLIIFKANALGYINGIGPDITGANNQYSDFILIQSTVGCANPNSIVLQPAGLMFQSPNKGIWLLGRDLSTSYIGSQVETYTQGATVLSVISVPGTTQVRFTLDTGVTLMFDYFFNQWGTFTNIPAVSSVSFQNLHTYLNDQGQVLQETQGQYLDGSNPVLMSFKTGWFNLAGLQGFERFYFGYLLGTYKSPFKLNLGLAYNYNPSAVQSILVTPDNKSDYYGGSSTWGSNPTYGGTPSVGLEASANVFEARFFPETQKCESFQITLSEYFDASLGLAAGEGLTLSGITLITGMKRGFRTQRADRSFG